MVKKTLLLAALIVVILSLIGCRAIREDVGLIKDRGVEVVEGED